MLKEKIMEQILGNVPILRKLHKEVEKQSGLPYYKFHPQWDSDFVNELTSFSEEEQDYIITIVVQNFLDSPNDISNYSLLTKEELESL